MRVASEFDVGDTSDILNSVNSMVTHANDHVTEASTSIDVSWVSLKTSQLHLDFRIADDFSVADCMLYAVSNIYRLGHCLVKYGLSYCIQGKHLSDLCQPVLRTAWSCQRSHAVHTNAHCATISSMLLIEIDL